MFYVFPLYDNVLFNCLMYWEWISGFYHFSPNEDLSFRLHWWNRGLLFLKVSLLSLFIYLLHLLCFFFLNEHLLYFSVPSQFGIFLSHNTLVYSYLNLAMYCADLGVYWSWNEFLINVVCWQNAAGTLQTNLTVYFTAF